MSMYTRAITAVKKLCNRFALAVTNIVKQRKKCDKSKKDIASDLY